MLPDDGPLSAPHRAIRGVRAPEDAPWPGVLARTPAGASVVLVDAHALGTAWLGWAAPAEGHVLAPLDIARRADGHDAVLPVCLERLDDFLRRRAARTPLTTGEAVTLGVSILRGCAQIAHVPSATGEWWLDADGRPVLTTDASTRGAFEGAAAALQSVPVDGAARDAWHAAVRAVSAERVHTLDLAEAEDGLFAIAAPEPLATTILNPRSAADLRARDVRDDSVPGDAPPPRALWASLVARVDDDIADTLSRATTAVWRRARTRSPSRRAPWAVGGGLAAAILIGGALWPAAGGVATSDPAPAASSSPSALHPGADADPVDSGDTAAHDAPSPMADTAPDAADLTVVADALIVARLDCGGDQDCLRAVLADPAAELTAGVIDLPAKARTTTLLDDFGGVAVLRMDPIDAGSPSQLVVIVLRDGRWLLRDVHDVAQQP